MSDYVVVQEDSDEDLNCSGTREFVCRVGRAVSRE